MVYEKCSTSRAQFLESRNVLQSTKLNFFHFLCSHFFPFSHLVMRWREKRTWKKMKMLKLFCHVLCTLWETLSRKIDLAKVLLRVVLLLLRVGGKSIWFNFDYLNQIWTKKTQKNKLAIFFGSSLFLSSKRAVEKIKVWWFMEHEISETWKIFLLFQLKNKYHCFSLYSAISFDKFCSVIEVRLSALKISLTSMIPHILPLNLKKRQDVLMFSEQS